MFGSAICPCPTNCLQRWLTYWQRTKIHKHLAEQFKVSAPPTLIHCQFLRNAHGNERNTWSLEIEIEWKLVKCKSNFLMSQSLVNEWKKFFLFKMVCLWFGRCSHQASGLMDKQQSTTFKAFQKEAQGKINPLSFILAMTFICRGTDILCAQ